MQNKRVHLRYDVALAVEIRMGPELVSGQAKNLSLGGVGIAADSPLEAEAPVLVQLVLLEEGIEDERAVPLQINGRVVWCQQDQAGGWQAGIRFGALQPREQQALLHYLERLKAQR